MSDRLLPGPLTRSVENLSAVLRMMLPGRDREPLHSGATDALAAALVLLAALAAADAAGFGQIPSYWGLRDMGGGLFLQFAGLGLAVAVLGRSRSLSGTVVGTLWAATLGAALAIALARWIASDWVYVGVTSALPVLFLIAFLGALRGGLAALAYAAPAAWWALSPVLYPAADMAGATPVPDTEAVYGAQAGLMARQVSALRPGVPGRPELFAVLGAGDPTEAVFRREVEAVAGLLATRFGAKDRVIRLVNSDRDPTGLPLLNRTNLTAALRAEAELMDPEDILLLFLTSHGAPDLVATSFDGVATRDLTAPDLARALDDSGVWNVVAIVSACYSGSFVEDLAAPDRLILTAAANDRTSFGCADENEWTDWGRAFFVDALGQTDDPREAARVAAALVAEREAAAGYEASWPQIDEGSAIGPTLDRWLAEAAFR